MSLLKSADKYLSFVRIEIVDWLAGGMDLLFGLIFLFTLLFLYYNLWSVGFGSSIIAGYSVETLILYIAITESVWLSVGRVNRTMDIEIKEGQVANFLAKPIHYLKYHYFRAMGKAIPNFLLMFGFGLLLAFLFSGKIPLETFAILPALIVFFLAISLHLIFMIGLGLLGFFTEDASAYFFVYSKAVMVFGGLVFPLEFYPKWLADLSYMLPFQLATFAPAKVLTHFSFDYFLQTVFWQLVWIGIAIVLADLIFRIIQKRVIVQGG